MKNIIIIFIGLIFLVVCRIWLILNKKTGEIRKERNNLKLKIRLKRGIIVEPIEIDNEKEYFTWWNGQFSRTEPEQDKEYEIEPFNNIENVFLE